MLSIQAIESIAPARVGKAGRAGRARKFAQLSLPVAVAQEKK
jgi:hypothetical protein